MSFTWNGFRLLPGKGLIAGIVVILALAIGLAYSLSMALQNAGKVRALEDALSASHADLEALRGIISAQHQVVISGAKEAARVQSEVQNAKQRIEQAGRRAGPSGSLSRLRREREEAAAILRDIAAPSSGVSGGDATSP